MSYWKGKKKKKKKKKKKGQVPRITITPLATIMFHLAQTCSNKRGTFMIISRAKVGGTREKDRLTALSRLGTSASRAKWVHSTPTAQSNSKLRANPAGARISLGRWVILKSCSRRANLAALGRYPHRQPSRHTPPEPTGKMKYIHSEETLDIPEGGTINPLRRLNPNQSESMRAVSCQEKEEDKRQTATPEKQAHGSRTCNVLMHFGPIDRRPPTAFSSHQAGAHWDATDWASVPGD
jgi:hypothetical protein